jgi:glycerol uptake facilitator-like aquaporin
LNLVVYGGYIATFEGKKGIIRGSAAGIASAKCFGEYFLPPVTTMTAFLAECIGTTILAFVIFALTHPNNDTVENGFVPPIIGLTVGGLIAVFAPLTQAGFNPARDFGPRIVAWFAGWRTVAFTNAWLYIFAPIVGAVLGAALADKVLFANYTVKN